MTAEEQKCQQCGAELPPNAPGGICPKCVMKLALPTGADPERPPAQKGQHAVPTSATPPGGFVPPEPAELNEKIPELEIIDLLGHGGMGAVYKARQKHLDRIVALKILPPEVGKDPAFAERFTREARSLAKLNHPHIVTVYEFGRSDDLYYFIMEFVDGTDLRHVIRKGDLAAGEALTIVPQVCEALQYAHEEGVVHRDIKPENILLDRRGNVKIGDFGLAKILDVPPTAYTLTQPQQKMGTPHYMAPEQIEGAHQVDHRADIYSLGVVFYEMLTGQLPIGRFPPPSQKVHVDVRLDNVVLRSLEHEPERRYQHASEVKTDVEVIAVDAEHQKPTAKPTEIDPESPEQFILSRLPSTRIDAVKAYQKKTGAGRVEAVLAIDAMMRKHGIKFTRVPLKLGRLLAAAAALIVYYVLYILFRRHVEINSTLGWSVMALFCIAVFISFSVAAWRSRSIDKGFQFRFLAGFFLFLLLLNPLLILLIKPTLILKRLYGLTGADPGLHDVAFLRIVVGVIIVGGLYWLLKLWLQFRTSRKIDAEFASRGRDEVRPKEDGSQDSAGKHRDTRNVLGVVSICAAVFGIFAIVMFYVLCTVLERLGIQVSDSIGLIVFIGAEVSALVMGLVAWRNPYGKVGVGISTILLLLVGLAMPVMVEKTPIRTGTVTLQKPRLSPPENSAYEKADGTQNLQIQVGPTKFAIDAVARWDRTGHVLITNGKDQTPIPPSFETPDYSSQSHWMDVTNIYLSPEASQYDVLELRVFDHSTRELLQLEDRLAVGYDVKDGVVQLRSVGSLLPDNVDVWMRVLHNPKTSPVWRLNAEKGASANLVDGSLLLREARKDRWSYSSKATLPESHPGRRELSVAQIDWNKRSETGAEVCTAVFDFPYVKAIEPSERDNYQIAAISKDGSRHVPDSPHFLTASVGKTQVIEFDLPAAELSHFEIRPFHGRDRFYFDDIRLPGVGSPLGVPPTATIAVNGRETSATIEDFAPVKVRVAVLKGERASGVEGRLNKAWVRMKEEPYENTASMVTIIYEINGLRCGKCTFRCLGADGEELDARGGGSTYTGHPYGVSAGYETKRVPIEQIDKVLFRIHY